MHGIIAIMLLSIIQALQTIIRDSGSKPQGLAQVTLQAPSVIKLQQALLASSELCLFLPSSVIKLARCYHRTAQSAKEEAVQLTGGQQGLLERQDGLPRRVSSPALRDSSVGFSMTLAGFLSVCVWVRTRNHVGPQDNATNRALS